MRTDDRFRTNFMTLNKPDIFFQKCIIGQASEQEHNNKSTCNISKNACLLHDMEYGLK